MDDDHLKDSLDSNYIGSNPLEKKGFFLRDLRDYRKIDKDFYIIFEEVSNCKKRFSNKLDYYKSNNNDDFYLELKKKINIDQEGKIILTVTNFDNRNIITSFKFKNNIYEYKKKEDCIQVFNSIYNLEFLIFLKRDSYNELFTIEKIQIFKN